MIRQRNLLLPLALSLGAFHAGALADGGRGDSRNVQAKLSGYEEVPAVSTAGSGTFKARIDKATGEVDYEFSYKGLQGTVRQAHIHFAQRGVNGGVAVWLCQSATNPAPGALAGSTPECTSPAGEFSGRITAASVLGPGAQQLAPGELEELVAALRAGATYVNVHTASVPSGEIRGQIGDGHKH